MNLSWTLHHQMTKVDTRSQDPLLDRIGPHGERRTERESDAQERGRTGRGQRSGRFGVSRSSIIGGFLGEEAGKLVGMRA